MEKNKTLYLVWQQEGDCTYWNQYESLEEAVGSEGGKNVTVYEATPKLVGTYDSSVKTVLSKCKKKAV